MRKAVDCEIRNPLAPELPSVFQAELEAARGEGFFAAVIEAFDRSLAPVHLVLDELSAYIDPHLVPNDMLPMLLGWLALPDDRSRSVDERRRLVARATGLYRDAGTAAGLQDQLAQVAGWDVDVEENGATVAANDPATALPGSPALALHVRFRVPAGVDPADPAVARRVESLVHALKPAHVPHTVEVVSTADDAVGDSPSSSSTSS